MKAESMHHRVIIQQATETKGAAGGLIKTWSTYISRWAAIEPLTGREFREAQKENAETNYRIRIRYASGVTPKMRVLYGTKAFEILSVVNPLERNIETHLMCKEVV